MPKVHFVKKARKDNPVCKAGESYYWWKFRYGGKRYSLTRPRASQLTQSEYLGQIYEMEEEVSDSTPEDRDELESIRDDMSSRLQDLGSEQSEKRYNMPDALQDSDSGMLLEEREQACEAAADALDSLDLDFEPETQREDFEDPDDEEQEEADIDLEYEAAVQEELNGWITEKLGEMSEAISEAAV